MDKYEYKLKLDQIKNLIEAKDYKTAAQIAGGVNWKKVKSAATLCMIGELYEQNRQLEESREILLMAYDRSPVGRNIIYRLTHVAIKMGSLEEAQEYYEEFIEIAPYDNMKYVLKYQLAQAKGAGIQEQIAILEEFKEREYTEEWAFELAYLYHKAGKGEKCVDVCDELILWFGEGKYVEKALELKMLYQPLNKLQEDKYRRFKQKQEGVVEVSPFDDLMSGEIVREPVKIPHIKSDAGRFNTVNLQAELAKNMQQIMNATKQETVNDTLNNMKKIMGEIPHLYEPMSMEATQEIPQDFHMEMAQEPNPQMPHQEESEEMPVEAALDINFKEILAEEYDGQISLRVPDAPKQDLQITGQMSIADILAEWEKTKEAARIAMEEARQRKLEEAKVKALQEAENMMERLADVMPEMPEIPMPEAEPEMPEPEMEIPEFEMEMPEPELEIPEPEMVMPEPELEIPEPEMVIPEPVIPEPQVAITEPESVIPQVAIPKPELEIPEVSLDEVFTEEAPATQLSEEQQEIFSYFTLISGMEQQICQALEGVKQRKRNRNNSLSGNLAIIGEKGSGKTVLATDFIKAYQKLSGEGGGKVGKISASVLNQKDIGNLFQAVEGGYLIIENAGDLSRESVEKLAQQMAQDTKGLLVVLEDDKAGIEKAKGRSAEFAKMFTEKIRIPIFTLDELVAFANAYAQEQNCKLDGMAVLALYNSINNIQKLDEPTTLTEVKEIMDDAIYNANKGGLKKIFGGKRNIEDGKVLIREKDFE